MKRLIALSALLLIGLAPAAPPDEVDKILEEVAAGSIDDVWTHVPRLEKLGRTALGKIGEATKDDDAKVRLVASIVLYRSEMRDAGIDTLKKLIESSTSDVQRASAHAGSILVMRDLDLNAERKGEFEKFLREQAKGAEKGADRRLETSLWLAYWRLTRFIEPRRVIRSNIFDTATDPDVKDEAALALAEMDAFSRDVVQHLRGMSVFPTPTGQMAAAYLRLNELNERLAAEILGGDQKPAAGGGDYPPEFALLKEVYEQLKEHHVDPTKVDLQKMIRNAARGMSIDIDPYTAYYDEEMIKQLREEDLEGRYGGIGARVAMKRDRGGTSWLTIVEPIFSGPAYANGIRSGDMITSIEGESTANQDLQVLVSKLRGKEATKVKFKVYSRRWRETREFEIERAAIQMDTTLHRMLPGNIGYIALTTFGERNSAEMRAAIRELEADGMRGLVLDLRGNSGGYLDTAWRTADLFLPRGALIVSSKGRGGVEEERYEARRDAETQVPLVVLVDEMSASASEILAGALQAHDRATLVGTKTFGKGSVQKLKPLDTTKGATAVRITVAKWFLEGDVSVEKDDPAKNGIEPDIAATMPERDLWLEAESDRIARDGKMDAYLRERFEPNKDLFVKLADWDAHDASKYPGFEDLYRSLETKADPEQVREVLREELRYKVADSRGKAYICDYERDTVLQRGILEVCKKVGLDPAQVEEYKAIVVAPSKEKDPDTPED